MSGYDVGKGRPPKETQFQKGKSGNSKGRPKGLARGLPHDAALGQMLTVREGGTTYKLRADQAFIKYLANTAMVKGGRIAQIALTALQTGKSRRHVKTFTYILRVYTDPGDVVAAMEALGAASTLFECQPAAKVVIEAWAVELALSRMTGRQLSLEDQRIVVASTRQRQLVPWPEWWTVHDIGDEPSASSE